MKSKFLFISFLLSVITTFSRVSTACAQDFGCDVQWDSHSLILAGKRVVPAMGEVHYSRIPASEWAQELRKMKEGGITILACYVFWNHIEELEGQWDWSGQRNLRQFL